MTKSIRNMFSLVQILVGWEYLVAGLNKLLSSGFPYHLSNTLNGLKGQGLIGLYINILKSTVIPYSVIFGYLIEFGEVLAGLALIVLSLISILKKSDNSLFLKSVIFILMLASLATAFMSLNYWFMNGAPSFLPGQSPWGEGMDIDSFTAILSVIIAWYNAIVLWNAFKK